MNHIEANLTKVDNEFIIQFYIRYPKSFDREQALKVSEEVQKNIDNCIKKYDLCKR